MNASTPETHHRPRRWWRWLTWFGLATLIVVAGLWAPIFCLSYPTLLAWSNRVPFDSAVWKAHEGGTECYDMSWDLIHTDVLTEKTRAEVEELLGEPMTTDRFGEAPLPKFSASRFEAGIEIWYYDLGDEKYEWQLGPSGAVLAVDFQEGKVVGVRKVVH